MIIACIASPLDALAFACMACGVSLGVAAIAFAGYAIHSFAFIVVALNACGPTVLGAGAGAGGGRCLCSGFCSRIAKTDAIGATASQLLTVRVDNHRGK